MAKKDDIVTFETKFVSTKTKIPPEGKHLEFKEPQENIQKLFKAQRNIFRHRLEI